VDLQDYLTIVRKRWLSIVLIVALSTAVTAAMTLSQTPLYTARTQLYVSVQGDASTSDLLSGADFSQQQVASYVQLVSSPRVLQPVIDQLQLGVSAPTLADRVSADSPLNTSLINVHATDPSPTVAASTANAIATQLEGIIGDLETPSSGGASRVKVSTVRDASVPTAPSSPATKLNLALGLLVGLLVGVGAAVLREVLNTRVHDDDDVARVTATSVIGRIPRDKEAPERPLIVQGSPHARRAESFRRLRTNLQFLQVEDRPRSLVVTSSVPGEGKSTTAINLAITLADAGTDVALVDADLRRPFVARYLGLEGHVGLTTVLIGRADLDDVIQPWGNGHVHVLTSGQTPPNPSELLGSQAMAAVMDQLLAQFDVVILDTPPLLPVTDAALVARQAGGAIVVVGAGTVHRKQLAEALRSLDAVGATVLGLVLNRQRAGSRDEYYDYGYAPEAPSEPRQPAHAAADGVASAPETRESDSAENEFWPGEAFTDEQIRELRAARTNAESE